MRSIQAALGALIVATALTALPASAAEVTIRLGTVAPRGTPWELQMNRTKDKLGEAIPGLKLKSYFGGAKGDEKSLVRQCRDGRLEMCGVSAAALATVVPDLQVLELPYLFESSKQADCVLDNHARPVLEEILENHGFVLYQLAENGWQNFASKDGFIKNPADLKGRKMRSQESPVHLAVWKAFGAAPVEMGVSEVLPALKTGLVDGFAQTPLFTFATGWYQGIEYYTVSRHLYQPGMIVYSKKWFDKQSADVRSTLKTTDIKAGEAFARQGIRAIEKPLIDNFTKAGIAVHELTPQERAKFVTISEKFHKTYAKKASAKSKKLLKAIEAGKNVCAK